MGFWSLLTGAYLGWSIGANDTANVFGTAVLCKALRLSTAAVLCSIFVVIGAVQGGEDGIVTISALSQQSLASATYVAVSAGLAITILATLRLSAPSSQAVVGALIGVGYLEGTLQPAGLLKVFTCWLSAPVAAFILAILLYRLAAIVLNRLTLSIYQQDTMMRLALSGVGCYGAYALGQTTLQM